MGKHYRLLGRLRIAWLLALLLSARVSADLETSRTSSASFSPTTPASRRMFPGVLRIVWSDQMASSSACESADSIWKPYLVAATQFLKVGDEEALPFLMENTRALVQEFANKVLRAANFNTRTISENFIRELDLKGEGVEVEVVGEGGMTMSMSELHVQSETCLFGYHVAVYLDAWISLEKLGGGDHEREVALNLLTQVNKVTMMDHADLLVEFGAPITSWDILVNIWRLERQLPFALHTGEEHFRLYDHESACETGLLAGMFTPLRLTTTARPYAPGGVRAEARPPAAGAPLQQLKELHLLTGPTDRDGVSCLIRRGLFPEFTSPHVQLAGPPRMNAPYRRSAGSLMGMAIPVDADATASTTTTSGGTSTASSSRSEDHRVEALYLAAHFGPLYDAIFVIDQHFPNWKLHKHGVLSYHKAFFPEYQSDDEELVAVLGEIHKTKSAIHEHFDTALQPWFDDWFQRKFAGRVSLVLCGHPVLWCKFFARQKEDEIAVVAIHDQPHMFLVPKANKTTWEVELTIMIKKPNYFFVTYEAYLSMQLHYVTGIPGIPWQKAVALQNAHSVRENPSCMRELLGVWASGDLQHVAGASQKKIVELLENPYFCGKLQKILLLDANSDSAERDVQLGERESPASPRPSRGPGGAVENHYNEEINKLKILEYGSPGGVWHAPSFALRKLIAKYARVSCGQGAVPCEEDPDWTRFLSATDFTTSTAGGGGGPGGRAGEIRTSTGPGARLRKMEAQTAFFDLIILWPYDMTFAKLSEHYALRLPIFAHGELWRYTRRGSHALFPGGQDPRPARLDQLEAAVAACFEGGWIRSNTGEFRTNTWRSTTSFNRSATATSTTSAFFCSETGGRGNALDLEMQIQPWTTRAGGAGRAGVDDTFRREQVLQPSGRTVSSLHDEAEAANEKQFLELEDNDKVENVVNVNDPAPAPAAQLGDQLPTEWNFPYAFSPFESQGRWQVDPYSAWFYSRTAEFALMPHIQYYDSLGHLLEITASLAKEKQKHGSASPRLLEISRRMDAWYRDAEKNVLRFWIKLYDEAHAVVAKV